MDKQGSSYPGLGQARSGLESVTGQGSTGNLFFAYSWGPEAPQSYPTLATS